MNRSIEISFLKATFFLSGLFSIAFFLGGCAGHDELFGSTLVQVPGPPLTPVDANDIAVAGSWAAKAIRNLPQITSASPPPLVLFIGVTSIIDKPIDTDPYTSLLRDRLLTGANNKIRYVERELPPLITSVKKKKSEDLPDPADLSAKADYQFFAELRGDIDDPEYKIQMQLVNNHTGEIVFNALYLIHPEEVPTPDQAGNAAPETSSPVPPPPAIPMAQPTTSSPNQSPNPSPASSSNDSGTQ